MIRCGDMFMAEQNIYITVLMDVLIPHMMQLNRCSGTSKSEFLLLCIIDSLIVIQHKKNLYGTLCVLNGTMFLFML